MENNIKRCMNCKHMSTRFSDEPCKSCRMYSTWEPKKGGFEPGDLVSKKNNAGMTNIYIYLRNNWVLRVPSHVIIRSLCYYRFSTFVDKLIADNKASWIDQDNLKYASSEDISTHDNRAKDLYLTETLNKWFSELIGETEKKDFKELSFQMRKIPYKVPSVSTTPNMIKNVIFSDPATIIFWEDGTKTVVKTQDGEEYDKEKGFAMAVCKKVFGNERDYYHVFKRWMRKGKEIKKEE